MYCRLSKDDKNSSESMSIQSQKGMLKRYAEENGLLNTKFYIDDGYSGANFNRPAFQQMLNDIKEWKVSCVITKDLSRLGRNYLESGTYIEMVFPKYKVRYIAINDGWTVNRAVTRWILPRLKISLMSSTSEIHPRR